MNTIPLTLDSYKPTYTVIGGVRGASGGDLPVSVLLLNRGPRLYRAALLQDLVKAGFQSIVSVEDEAETPELESLAMKFPQTRFVRLKDPANFGARINVGMRESSAPYVMVMWNDMRLSSSTLSSRFFDKVVDSNLACLAPSLFGSDGSQVPVCAHPAKAGKAFKVIHLPPASDGDKSLYPFDFAGVYSRAKFSSLGGFDWTIANPYWQALDFGLRIWLWGEWIACSQALKLRYEAEPVAYDVTPDADYGRFWLKCLAPIHKGDSASLPWGAFARYLVKSRSAPGKAIDRFKAARAWILACSFRFKQDAARLVDLWDPLP